MTERMLKEFIRKAASFRLSVSLPRNALNPGSFTMARPATVNTITRAWMMSDTLVGTPVAACMVVEPTRRAAKKMATTMVARGCS